MSFVLLDIGCLECEDPSAVLGIFEDRGTADAALDAAVAKCERRGAGKKGWWTDPSPRHPSYERTTVRRYRHFYDSHSIELHEVPA